jgi:putative MATE family efflux protein
MEKSKEFLGTEPIGKLLLKLAIPTVVAQLVNMLYNIVDRIYLGHMPVDGSLALTGVGVCTPIILFVSAFSALICSSGAPRSSIFMGEGDYDKAEETMGNCFTLQILVSVLLTILLMVFGEDLLLTFGASENTIGYATQYMNLYALGTIFVQLTLGMNAYVTAQGNAKMAMLTVMIGAVCNIILDPIFIFALDMGVAGAALATIISQGISCAWVVSLLLGKRSTLRLKKQYLRVRPHVVLPCIALGMATFIMQVSESVISVAFNSSLLKYGGDVAVGAMTILTSVMQFAMLPMQGIGQGAQPITSYNYGAKNAERVKKTFRLLLCTCLSYSVLVGTAVLLFPKTFAGIFCPDVTLLDFTAKALRIYMAGMVIFGIQIACQMTFVSIGNALCSIIVAVVRKFVLLLPLIYIVPQFAADKTMAVYLAEPIADVIAVTFTAFLFAVQFHKAIKKLQHSL